MPPRAPAKRERPFLGAHVDPELAKRVLARCDAEDVTVSQVIRRALKAFAGPA